MWGFQAAASVSNDAASEIAFPGASAVSAINYWLPQGGVATANFTGLFPNREDR
jgi:hypothetical protein